jgi:glycosyltransferase involved in cell wall biosynthesis
VTDVVITSNTLQIGGAERQRVMLANGLAARGHSVTFVTLQDFGPLADELEPAVRLTRRPPVAAAAPRADVVISGVTNTEVAYAVCSRGGRRARHWVAAAHSSAPSGSRVYTRKLGIALRRADRVVALSGLHADVLGRRDARADRIVVIPNGTPVPPTVARTTQERPARPVADRPLRIGYLGRLADPKGLDILLEALTGIDAGAWSLDIWGEGVRAADWRSLAARILPGAAVQWHGWTGDVANALARVDVLAVPSRTEAQPMALLEAMAAGVPVLASDVGCVGEILEGGRLGGLVPPTAAGWAGAIRTAAADRQLLLDRTAAAAESIRRRYSVDAMVSAYERLLEELT